MKRLITTILSIIMATTAASAEHYRENPEPFECHFEAGEDGGLYWYENGKLQGAPGDPLNITDTIYGEERGREIFDPDTDAWYWLDACYGGRAAFDKEAWLPYEYQNEEPGSTKGKWVRYDETGAMVKYFCYDENGLHYYHNITGKMLKGKITFEDRYQDDKETEEVEKVEIVLFFDRVTGVCELTEEAIAELGKLTGENWPVRYNGEKTNLAEFLRKIAPRE